MSSDGFVPTTFPRVDALFADLRAYVGLTNPLCLDADQRCPRCGGRLNEVGPESARRVEPCVLGCGEA